MSWPFTVGAGPFGIKGTAFRGHLEYVAAELPGGCERMLETLEPEYRDFWSQRFLVNKYYDIHPLIAAAAPCARLAGVDWQVFVSRRTRWQAKKDVTGLYAFFARALGSRRLAQLMPRAFALYLDFIRVEVRDEGDRLHAMVHGIPVPFASWFTVVFLAYGEELLSRHGDPRVRILPGVPKAGDRRHGIKTVSFPFWIHGR